MEHSQDSEAELIQRATAGDVQAYEWLYRQHVGRVNALCLRMTRDPSEAEELVQDVFVRVWEKLGSFRGGSAFSTWVHRVAVNTTIERLRARARWHERHDGAADPAASADRTFAQSHGADLDLEVAIARLPERARMVFILHDVDGHKHREIADMTGLAVGTCKAHLHRARLLLREILSEVPREGAI
ncbi:MAG: sigma-70 family RNA polymerase sigma factor [bacterium]|nr:sigma-70 family RNA polymerase sigma factor [bacterium]MCP5040503.1 sigma-70 family RNA polymerase sigma factor [bacterium]